MPVYIRALYVYKLQKAKECVVVLTIHTKVESISSVYVFFTIVHGFMCTFDRTFWLSILTYGQM